MLPVHLRWQNLLPNFEFWRVTPLTFHEVSLRSWTAVKLIVTLPHDEVVHRLQVFSQCVVHGGLLLQLAWL